MTIKPAPPPPPPPRVPTTSNVYPHNANHHKNPPQDQPISSVGQSHSTLNSANKTGTPHQKTHSNNNSNTVNPIDAAAQLIQHLDENFHTMNASAQSAQQDSENARENARAAMEIARRYATRSYTPKTTPKPMKSPAASTISNKKSKMMAGFSRSEESSSALSMNMNMNMNMNGNDPHMMHYPNSSSDSHPNAHRIPSPPRADDATPRMNNQNHMNPQSQSQNQLPSSHQKLAQSHAEDVLTLSLELEQTKAELSQLQNSSQSIHDHYQAIIQQLEEKVENAEEDANTALELARESADSRGDLENYLGRALKELEVAKENLESKEDELQLALEQQKESQALTVHNPNDRALQVRQDDADGGALVVAPPKAMVAMGRDMLYRRRAVLNKRFRQHKLQYGMRQHDDILENGSVGPENNGGDDRYSNNHRANNYNDSRRNTFGSKNSNSTQNGSHSNHTNARVIRTLKESAKRMGFLSMGMGLSRNIDNRGNEEDGEFEDLESMVEQYCKSVEVSPCNSSLFPNQCILNSATEL